MAFYKTKHPKEAGVEYLINLEQVALVTFGPTYNAEPGYTVSVHLKSGSNVVLEYPNKQIAVQEYEALTKTFTVQNESKGGGFAVA